jgi:hypothetical protein
MPSKLIQTKKVEKKASPARPISSSIQPLAPSNLPEQELFTVEDIAARWNKSVSYVKDLTRRGVLPMNKAKMQMILGPPKQLKFSAFVTHKDLIEFERKCNELPPFLTIGQMAVKEDVTKKTVQRWIKAKKVKAIKGPTNRWKIFP